MRSIGTLSRTKRVIICRARAHAHLSPACGERSMRTPLCTSGEGGSPHAEQIAPPPHPTPLPASGEREQTEPAATLCINFTGTRFSLDSHAASRTTRVIIRRARAHAYLSPLAGRGRRARLRARRVRGTLHMLSRSRLPLTPPLSPQAGRGSRPSPWRRCASTSPGRALRGAGPARRIELSVSER
jgi:hypothetical protein